MHKDGSDRVQRAAVRRRCRGMLAALAAGLLTCSACVSGARRARAVDLPTLDRVGVMMSFDQVNQIAGNPDAMARVEPDYTLATWNMTDAPGMIAAGGIFDQRNALIALAYIFAGQTADQALASMRSLGFRMAKDPSGAMRIYGKGDDDSGRPLVMVIDEQPDATTVYAFDQGEYDKRVAAGSLPKGHGTPLAMSAPEPQKPGMDPAVRAALITGLSIMAGGPMGPGTRPQKWEKSTTLSSSSHTTYNADGSVTTRSSKTTASVGVGVNPAGVANALLMLLGP